MLVTAVLAAPAGAPAAIEQLPPVVGDTLPELPIEPPQLPLPPLPEVEVPDVPLPLPAPAPLPTPVPLPVPAPAPSSPEPPAAAGTSAAPAGAARTPAPQGAATPAAPDTATRAPDRDGARAAPRRAASRPARRPAAARRDRGSAAPDRPRPAAVSRVSPTPPKTRPAVDRPAAPASQPAGPPSTVSRVAGKVEELVRALPPAVLWALLGIAAIALGLAVNAFWQSRQRRALEAQRAELLDDIGTLSRALLPAVPEGLDGVAVSAAYRPADGPAAGGDFYDVFMLGAQRFCVLLGDVSGHGRESVTKAALARYTLRTLLAAGHPPGEALARADGLLTRDLSPNFVTVIAGVYDPATGELTYAKAGHAPPIVLGAAHDPDAEVPAPPLGLGFGDVWPEYRVQLSEGVSVCLFTDGLEDAQVGDARVGRDAVVRLLAAQEAPDAGRLIGDLEHLANRMCDDTAAVVLSCR